MVTICFDLPQTCLFHVICFLFLMLLTMIFFFLFLHLFPTTLPEDNHYISNINESLLSIDKGDRLHRYPKEVSSGNTKPMDCKKLHSTENTPWIAVILNGESGRLLCLGTIIDERHILTAQQCIYNTEPLKFKILLGYYKAYWGRHSQVMTVEDVYKHPYDLVILKVTKTIVFSKTVKPIRLLGTKAPKRAAAAAVAPVPVVSDRVKVPLVKRAALQNPLRSLQYFNNQSETFESDPFNSDESMDRFEDGFTNKAFTLNRVYKKNVDAKVPDSFKSKYSEMEDVLVVGFPVTYMDAIGSPISKNLVYTMREDKVAGGDGTSCSKQLHRDLIADTKVDDSDKFRYYCLNGESKFCWGCMGGPILDPKTMKQVGVIGFAGTKDNCEKSASMYLALRVDIFSTWIRQNSFYV